MKFRFADRLMPLRDRLERRTGARPPEKPAPRDEGAAAQALAAKRGRASIAPAPRAGKAAAALLRPIMPQGGMGLSELKRRWKDIVGVSFGDRASPEKLAAGVLTLRAPGAIAPFLQQQAPLIIERLRLAGAQVKSIRIEQRTVAPAKAANLRTLRRNLTPLEEDAILARFEGVDDPTLKAALTRLGRAVKRP
ncbi:MAG: DciA family protein [Pseudomonadota bacterium]